MNLAEKINYQLLKLLRMTWFSIRYGIFKWKNIEGIFIPVQMHYGYPVLRFIDNGEYEQGEITIIKNTLEKEDIVLELGTGIGFVSAFCARRIGDDRVYTFEANASLEENIQTLYTKNGVQPKLCFAILGKQAGTRTFYRNKGSFLASSAFKSEGVQQEATQMKVLGLNETIAAIRPTYLMMDIEGSEYDIFSMIDFQTIRKIQFELHPAVLGTDKTEAIFTCLRDNGFIVDNGFSTGNNYYFRKG